MARSDSTGIRATLNRLIPRSRLRALAAETGAVLRERKVNVVSLVWTLVLGFATGNTRTLAGLRRAFGRATGNTLVPSAFYGRLTPQLVRLLRAVLVEVIEKVGRGRRALVGQLAAFRDVVIADSTVIRLHELLWRKFPACRTNHTKAAMKAHVIISVTGRGPRSVKVTSERVHDGPVLRAGAWMRDHLLLFDLGYYRYQLFACIARQGGYFISRLKDRSNPLITAVYRSWRGRSVPVVGERLQDVLARLRRQELDIEVELRFQHRAYLGQRRGARERVRLVGVRDERSGEYHMYLTNIPADRFSCEDIARTYAARWIVELAFRELKSQYRMEQMPSSKAHIVEALLLAAFIAMMVSRALLERTRRSLPAHQRDRVPDERWAAIFVTVATELLALMLRPPAYADSNERFVEQLLRQEAVDPNAARLGLLARAQRSVAPWES